MDCEQVRFVLYRSGWLVHRALLPVFTGPPSPNAQPGSQHQDHLVRAIVLSDATEPYFPRGAGLNPEDSSDPFNEFIPSDVCPTRVESPCLLTREQEVASPGLEGYL